jgi:SAM-dependent methyltransferase
MENSGGKWFESWFDSPYYALLYRHRDVLEAAGFISRLMAYLKLPPGSGVLDLACGKGRHSVQLAELGFNVTGLDLSARSIAEADTHARLNLRFVRDDMRNFQLSEKFELVVNLFTSFGYFEDESENVRVLNQVKSHLKDGGQFVLDYFNSHEILRSLRPEEMRNEEGVAFDIRRYIESKRVVKEISIKHDGFHHRYYERVQLLNHLDLQKMIDGAGLKVSRMFGDYDLSPFDPETSKRVILIARKN